MPVSQRGNSSVSPARTSFTDGSSARVGADRVQQRSSPSRSRDKTAPSRGHCSVVIVAWPPPNHGESVKIWPIDHRRIWHVEPLSRFIWLLRVPQQDLIATLRHIPRGLCVLGVSSVTARLARLAGETLEPRLRSGRLESWA